jgi:hypothetical protein
MFSNLTILSQLPLFSLYLKVTNLQVSLAIRGGYVPEKSQTANTKTVILGLIRLKLAVFPRYSRIILP